MNHYEEAEEAVNFFFPGVYPHNGVSSNGEGFAASSAYPLSYVDVGYSVREYWSCTYSGKHCTIGHSHHCMTAKDAILEAMINAYFCFEEAVAKQKKKSDELVEDLLLFLAQIKKMGVVHPDIPTHLLRDPQDTTQQELI